MSTNSAKRQAGNARFIEHDTASDGYSRKRLNGSEGLEDCLAVLNMPKHNRKRLASTKLLENLIKRLKKRTGEIQRVISDYCFYYNRIIR
jgi:hypothetical protein